MFALRNICRCPRGGYCPASGAASVRQVFIPCLEGTYNPSDGASSNASCQLCEPGKSGFSVGAVSAESCIACPIGKYNPTAGLAFSAACQRCPEFSSTLNDSSTQVTDCICGANFERSINATSDMAVCECARGFQIVEESRCEPCPIGTFKDSVGNSKCIRCPVPRTITAMAPGALAGDLAPGADSIARCVCEAGTYASATYAQMQRDTFVCHACDTAHYSFATAAMTNCTMSNVTLDRIPVNEGYWRQNAASLWVRQCSAYPAACHGGVLAGDDSCAPGELQ